MLLKVEPTSVTVFLFVYLFIIFFILDIDECGQMQNMINDCEQLCFNLVGSYVCGCQIGYELSENGRNCTGT